MATKSGLPGNLWRFHRRPGVSFYTNDFEYERYAFLNLTEFLPHAVIRSGKGMRKLSTAPTAVSETVDGTSFGCRLGQRSVREYAEDPSTGVDGIVVLVDGEIALEVYTHMNPEDRHNLMSVTKSFVGFLIWLFYERGHIDLNATVDQYVPQLKGSGWEGVTVVNLLDHASGIAAVETSEGSVTNPENPYYGYEVRIGYLGPRQNDLSSA